MGVAGAIDGEVEGVLRGWAWDPALADDRLRILVLADGTPLGECLADRPRGDLKRAGIGDGAHGLEFPLPLALLDGSEHDFALLRADGAGEVAAARIMVPARTHLLRGKFERIEGLNLVGWVADRARPGVAKLVELVADGRVCGRTLANRLRGDLRKAGIGTGAHGFVMDLAVLRPALKPGTEFTLRTDAGDEHWVLGTGTMPVAPAAPAGVRPEAQAEAARLLGAAREAERRGDVAGAAGLLDAGLALVDRHDAEMLWLRARAALGLNEPEAARDFARAGLALRPGDAALLVVLARATARLGAHAQAAELWAAIGPDDAEHREARLGQGRALLALGRPHEALPEFGALLAGDPGDLEALRGMTESADALGATRSAARHRQRQHGLAPGEAPAGPGSSRRAVGPASPLRNPSLHDWPAAVDGVAGAEPLAPCPGVLLRSTAPGGSLSYSAGDPREIAPGQLPVHGLSLVAEGGGAEIAFGLDPAAAPALARGVRLGWEMAVDVGMAIEALLEGPGLSRRLLEARLKPGPRLLDLALRIDAAEAVALTEGRLRLCLRLGGAGRLDLQAPRPLCPLAEEPALPGGFEDPALEGQPVLAVPRP
jgi:tetratricopeptide (TPR) repeat protein